MKIYELLEKNPYRNIGKVVKVNDHNPKIVKTELEEYIPTEEVKKYFRRVIEGFLETKGGHSEDVCVWISGFFGSGKSHFLKVMGYLLENREIDLGGSRTSSTSYIAEKIGLHNLAPMISKEFSNKVFFINLLDIDHATDPTISRLVYRKLMEDLGFSEDIWVSLWEEELYKANKYEEFKGWVQQEFGRDWNDYRKLNAGVTLKKALPKFLGYPNEDEAEKAIEDSKKKEIKPSDVVKRLKNYADEIDKNKGRVIVLLDEVGLYIGDSTDRLTDLNALAEQVVKEGDGRIWLITTSQEALPQMVDRFAAERQKLEWLKDRFKHYSLTPQGVETVVYERMLKKNIDGLDKIKEFYQNNAGKLSQVLDLSPSKQIFKSDEENFSKFYPFFPYSINLLQEISKSLVRSVDEARRLSARERSMLKIVHAILRGEGDIESFADKELGTFVTFDVLYDSISSDLRLIKSDYHDIIENEIGKLGEIDGVKVSSVAKALFLLQNVEERVAPTLDNISATLLPDIGADINKLKDAVTNCLNRLFDYGWVVRENGNYRILTYEEHKLEDTIRENLPRPAEKRAFLKEKLKEKLGSFKYQHGKSNRPFEVEFSVDEEKISEGNIKVAFYTPFTEKDEDQIEIDSTENPNIVFWIGNQENREFERSLERVIALSNTLEHFYSLSGTDKERQYVNALEKEYNEKSTEIPKDIESIFKKGVIYMNGVKMSPSDDLQKTLQEKLEPIANEVYSEFIDKRPKKDEECARILKWPEEKAPQIYNELDIIVDNKLNVNSSMITSTVFKEIENRRNYGYSRTGKDLTKVFEDPPYGWDPRLVRLAVASLFKAGKISVDWNNKLYYSVSPEVYNLFAKVSYFNKAKFDPLPEVDWRKASELLSSIFGVRGGDTFEKTSEKVEEVSENWLNKAKNLKTRAFDNELPISIQTNLDNFIKSINEVVETNDPNTRLRMFLEKEEELKGAFGIVKRLEKFNFEKYREINKFVRNPDVETALTDYKDKLEKITDTIRSDAIIDRLDETSAEYKLLKDTFDQKYSERHNNFNQQVQEALSEAKEHKAFNESPEETNTKLTRLGSLLCEELNFDNGLLYCTNCRRHYNNLNEYLVNEEKKRLLRELDSLLPLPREEEKDEFEVLEIQETIRGDQIDEVLGRIRDRVASHKGQVRVNIRIEPGDK